MNGANRRRGFVAQAMRHLRHHARQPRPVRSLAADLLGRTGACGWIVFAHAGVKLRLRRHGLSPLLWADPAWRLEGEIFFERFLLAGDTVVDVGANIGVHTLLAARSVGVGGRVLAIEAHPRTFAALEDNLRLNACGNVTAVQAAAGPETGTVRLSDRADDDRNQVSPRGELEVPMRRLDGVCAGSGPVALLKIDIEGFELPSLRGAAELLGRTECVLVEYWSEHAGKFGYDLAALAGWLEVAGFSGWVLDETAGRATVRALVCAEMADELVNLVFVRDRAALAGRLKEACA